MNLDPRDAEIEDLGAKLDAARAEIKTLRTQLDAARAEVIRLARARTEAQMIANDRGVLIKALIKEQVALAKALTNHLHEKAP